MASETNEISAEITIKIGEQEIVLTMEEAKDLSAFLNRTVGIGSIYEINKQNFPYTPYIPCSEPSFMERVSGGGTLYRPGQIDMSH